MNTSEVFFGAELAFMNWRSENPEMFTAIVALFLVIVAALCLYWRLTVRERKITAMRITRDRARRNYEADRMNGRW